MLSFTKLLPLLKAWTPMTWFINTSLPQYFFQARFSYSSQVFGTQVLGYSEGPVDVAALKPIETYHSMPEENVNSLGQAFRKKSIWLAPKILSVGFNVGIGWSTKQVSCHTMGLVTLCNHLSGEKTVCCVSTAEFCHAKYFLMLKVKSFTFPVDKGLTKPAQVLGTSLLPVECGSVLPKRIRASYHLKIQPQVMRHSSQVAGCTYSSAVLKIFQHPQRTNVTLT